MEIALNTLKMMPKTDLHVHLDGSVRINTLIDLARKQNVTLPVSSPAELKKILVPGLHCKSLADYLKPFDIVLQVLQEEEALAIAHEIAASPRQAVRFIKQLIGQNALEHDLTAIWKRESDALRTCFGLEEHKQAVRAFLNNSR